MNYAQLVTALNALGVTPPDINRASLYIDHLQNARNYFFNTLAVTLGADYAFVRTALRSTSLLTELAESLDLYIGAPVDADLIATGHNNWTYQQYFDNQILGPGYAANLNNFRLTYPVSTNSLTSIYNHFTGNILTACQRIIADKANLTTFYRQNLNKSWLFIRSLKHIKSSGSDFHKGGQQVLILTFSVIDLGWAYPSWVDMKLVYKPSDIEADCLIAGKSNVINSIVPGFMNNSLFEIYNAELSNYKITHPGFTGESLVTYGIYPRNYQSVHAGGFPLPVRQAYGYLEYLDNDLSGTAVEIYGYYPFGESDYMVFKGQDLNGITRKFYRMEGAMAALACTFSLHDLHLENVRVKGYLPNFIDMEISLNSATAIIDNTSLIAGTIGGINGLVLNTQDFVWEVQPQTAHVPLSLIKEYKDKYYQNRLWTWSGTLNRQNVAVDVAELSTGFVDGMTILREAQNNGSFNGWFLRLNNVVVRYIPYPTAFFKNILSLYALNSGNATGIVTPAELLMGELTLEANAYVLNDIPKFLALTPPESLNDLVNLDVPIFYYRIGMQEIINSNGAQVAIPANIQIFNPAPPPAIVNHVVNIGRATFLPNVPTTTIINAGQVQILGGAAGPYNARVAALQTSIINGMAAGAPPNPVVVIPVNQ